MNSEPVVIHLDLDDRIVFVNEAFDRFARANGAPELAGGAVLDRPLWEFVTGDEVRQLTRVLLARARSGHPIERVPYRCDSPTLRRYMQMTFEPLPRDRLAITSFERHIEPRPANPLLRQEPATEGTPLRMCSWCRRVDLGGDYWVEAEEAILILKLFEADHPPPIAHTICPDDMERLGLSDKE